MNVFVKGLDLSWTVKDLYECFEEYGDIKSAKVSLDPVTHKSRGYGYIWFKNEASASKAIKDSNENRMPLTVEAYKPRTHHVISPPTFLQKQEDQYGLPQSF